MLLLCAIVGGVSSAWAEDYSTTYTSNCTLSAGTNGSACKVKIGSSETEYDGIKVGTSSKGGTMTVTVPAGAKYLHVHVAAWNGVTGLSLNITPNTNITPTSISLTADDGISNSSPFTFRGTASSENFYKTITFTNALTVATTFTFTSTTKRFVIWGVNYESAATDPTITFSNGSVRVGHALDLSTLWSSNSNGAVTYSITSGDSYATLSGSTLTGTAEGSVTVQGSQAAADSYNAGTATATITVNAALTLSSIAVTTPPTKTTYLEGETFDATGMVVTATYSDASTDDVTDRCTFSPSTSKELTSSNTAIAISYTENAVEKTTSQAITVKALQSIALSGTYTTTFTQNGTFNHDGVVVTANYDGGDTKDVTSEASFTTPEMSTPGTKTVTVTYREQTTTYDITVNEYVQPTEVTVIFNDNTFGTNYSGSASGITDESPATANVNNVSVVYAGSGNHYISSNQIRFYPNNKLTFTAPDGYNITGIVFTPVSSATWAATISANNDTYTSITKTWSGNAHSVVFTGSGSSRCDMASATITLAPLTPTISVSESPTDFTYVEGSGPSEAQTISVSGANLTENISLALDDNSKFEMSTTEGSGYTSSLTLTPTTGTVSATTIYVRMKADQAKGNYTGTITMTSTGATSKTVDLTGSVTGQIYVITVDNGVTGGTISADKASAGEGATVTLTATPDAAYTFGSWSVYKTSDQATTVTVTNNQFDMPDYAVTVTATFNAKPTYAITCNYDDSEGLLEATPTSAYEGQTVTLSYVAETGYNLSAIVLTKTSDGSATDIELTASGDDYTFTMPAYAVTATATFEAIPTYTLASSIVPGKHYIIASGTSGKIKAMGSQNSNYRNVVEVTVSNNVISIEAGVCEFVIYGPDASNRYTIFDANYNETGGYLCATSSSSNYMGTQTTNNDNGKWTIAIENTGAASVTAQGTNTRKLMRFNSDRFSCYAENTSVNNLPYFYERVGEATPTAEVTIGASGYASYCSANALDFTSSDVKAYKAKVNNGNVLLTEVGKTPAEMGMVLYCETPGTYYVPTTSEPNTVSENEMVGVLERTQVSWNPSDGVYNYILQQGQFYKATESGGYLKANRAYLSTDFDVSAGNNSSSRMAIVFNDETTGIKSMDNGQWTIDNAVYDLQGRRVETPRKGSLYIVNGKKVVF